MTKKLDNRGISLVEIIIAVAIASIVSLLIATMLSNGSYWFTRENQKVDLQNDLQIVSNQLNDRFQEAKEIHIVKCDGAIRIYTGEIDPLTNNLVEQNKGTEKYTDSGEGIPCQLSCRQSGSQGRTPDYESAVGG